MGNEKDGINKDNAHPRAIELIPEEFFWSSIDELAPFGSDEGYTSLAEFRTWRNRNPTAPTIGCLLWVIKSVGEMNFIDYNPTLVSKERIISQLEDEDFDDHQYIYTLDNSVIATGFAQLVDEGVIDSLNKPVIKVAIDRQILWAELQDEWEYSDEYISKLKVLERALNTA